MNRHLVVAALILALFVVSALLADSKRRPLQIVGGTLLVVLCVGTPTVLG